VKETPAPAQLSCLRETKGTRTRFIAAAAAAGFITIMSASIEQHYHHHSTTAANDYPLPFMIIKLLQIVCVVDDES
jgi:hypothetical protein